MSFQLVKSKKKSNKKQIQKGCWGPSNPPKIPLILTNPTLSGLKNLKK